MRFGFLAVVGFSAALLGCGGEPEPHVEELVARFDAPACQTAVLRKGGGRQGRNGHEAFRNYQVDKLCVDQLIGEMKGLGFRQFDEQTYVRKPENGTNEQLTFESTRLAIVYELEWLEWGYDL